MVIFESLTERGLKTNPAVNYIATKLTEYYDQEHRHYTSGIGGLMDKVNLALDLYTANPDLCLTDQQQLAILGLNLSYVPNTQGQYKNSFILLRCALHSIRIKSEFFLKGSDPEYWSDIIELCNKYNINKDMMGIVAKIFNSHYRNQVLCDQAALVLDIEMAKYRTKHLTDLHVNSLFNENVGYNIQTVSSNLTLKIKRFLKLPYLYNTEYCRDLWESDTRMNLESLLFKLRSAKFTTKRA